MLSQCDASIPNLLHCPARKEWRVVFKSLKDCWICGNPVAPEDRGIDPFGFTVHAECDLKRQETSKPAPPAPEPKKTA
jgi:hypothetical protein